MKQLSAFLALNVNGGDRITYTYDEIDETGTIVEPNHKESTCVVDEELRHHVEAIRDWIRTNKLAD